MSDAPSITSVVQPVQAGYTVRIITLTFQLGTGSFGEQTVPTGGTGANRLTLENLRVYAHLEKVVSPQMASSAMLRVYGMTLDHMNTLSVAGLLFEGRQNYVLVQAGDTVVGLTTVFNGVIVEAYPVLDDPEDAHFYVYATAQNVIQLKPVAAVSYPGSAPAATVLQSLAKQAGIMLQNNGVSVVLSSPYFAGTTWQQILSAVKAADCFAFYDPVASILHIWPKNGASAPNATVLISVQTGMMGYPKFQKRQIIVRNLFSPTMNLNPSSGIQVKSTLTAANGKFIVNQISMDLMSQMPDGPWEVSIKATPLS